MLVTPPRCLTANRTQQGVLLSWLPPANHSFPIDRYVMEFRVGERWEMLDDAIPGTDGDFFAKDLSQVRSRLPLPLVPKSCECQDRPEFLEALNDPTRRYEF